MRPMNILKMTLLYDNVKQYDYKKGIASCDEPNKDLYYN